jgi:hypothetical protein
VDGSVLVERTRLGRRGVSLEFDRRIAFAADGRTLRAAERVEAPEGAAETAYSLPLE